MKSVSRRFPISRGLRLAAVLVATAALSGSLTACFPLVAGGMVGGALLASDRRTSGMYVEDEGIEVKAAQRINEVLGDRVHANVTSFNRMVLLTGEAYDQAAKAMAERALNDVANVRSVVNELQIGPTSSLASRSKDAYITSKVKARFVDANRFYANHVKVVTEANAVFLMGVVTREEADAATEIARTTTDVNRVVRAFEYISKDQAAQYDKQGAGNQAR